ncbi:uncharacterized protein JCM6883_000475 [Sporobolomyces salmoneus]|uniref:uncharacterized protein n=1 Tax=Sporobolomyces salmoneus TaxID=183962 RepID=UPI003174D769
MTSQNSPVQFDRALAGTLLPRLINLSQLATSASTSNSSFSSQSTGANEVEARASKLELNKQAASLRTSLNLLQHQANNLEAGDLSLEDQDWLIEELEKELVKKREELKKMVELTSFGAKAGEGREKEQEEDQTMQTE